MSAFVSCYTPKHVRNSEGNIPASKLQTRTFYDDVHMLVRSLKSHDAFDVIPSQPCDRGDQSNADAYEKKD